MWQKTARLVFSDWTDRFVAVLVRKVSGPHIEECRNGFEMDGWVGGWELVMRCFNDFV